MLQYTTIPCNTLVFYTPQVFAPCSTAVVVQAKTPPLRPTVAAGGALSPTGEVALEVCKDHLMTNSDDIEDADAGKKLRKALGSSSPRLPEGVERLCGWLVEHCDLGAAGNEAAARALNEQLCVETVEQLYAVDDAMWGDVSSRHFGFSKDSNGDSLNTGRLPPLISEV